MNLPQVMILLNCPLQEGDPHSFWNLVSIRDKDIKQPEFLLEVTEKLSVVPFQLSVWFRFVLYVVKVTTSCCATFDCV